MQDDTVNLFLQVFHFSSQTPYFISYNIFTYQNFVSWIKETCTPFLKAKQINKQIDNKYDI